MKKDKELRKKMAEMFADLEAEPQMESWENIQNAIKKPKKQKKFLWFPFLMVISFLLGTCFYLAFSWKENLKERNSRQLAARNSPKPFEETGKETIEKRTSLAEIKVSTAKAVKDNILTLGESSQKTDKIAKFIPTQPKNAQTQVSQMLPSSPIIRFGQEQAFNNALQKDSIQPTQKIDNKHINANHLTSVDTLFALSPIQQKNYILSQNTHYQNFVPNISKKAIFPQKRNFLSVEIAALSTFQLMQRQQNQRYSAGNVSLLPTFSTKRLGISTAVFYHRKLGDKNGILVGINGFLLPYNMEYEMQENNIYNVKFAQNGNYVIRKQFSLYQKRTYLANLGVELGYERHFSVKKKGFSIFISGISSKTFHQPNLNYWVKSGIKIPFNSQLSISPILQYQLNRQLDANKLIKTRFYSLGMSFHYTFCK